MKYRKSHDAKYRFAFYSPALNEIALVGHYMEWGDGKHRICFRNRESDEWDRPYWERRMREDIFNLTYPIYLGDIEAEQVKIMELAHLEER